MLFTLYIIPSTGKIETNGENSRATLYKHRCDKESENKKDREARGSALLHCSFARQVQTQ